MVHRGNNETFRSHNKSVFSSRTQQFRTDFQETVEDVKILEGFTRIKDLSFENFTENHHIVHNLTVDLYTHGSYNKTFSIPF